MFNLIREEGADFPLWILRDLLLEGRIDGLCDGQAANIKEVGEDIVDDPRTLDQRDANGINWCLVKVKVVYALAEGIKHIRVVLFFLQKVTHKLCLVWYYSGEVEEFQSYPWNKVNEDIETSLDRVIVASSLYEESIVPKLLELEKIHQRPNFFIILSQLLVIEDRNDLYYVPLDALHYDWNLLFLLLESVQ